MNRLSDIIEMGGNLYEEAWNNGRREALKEVNDGKYAMIEEANKNLGAQIDAYEKNRYEAYKEIDRLKEQVKRLDDDKRKLTQNLDHVIEENNDLELTIGRLKADLEKAKDENETLREKVAGYDGVSREQAKEVNRLKGKVKELNEALAIYRVPVTRDCPFCGGPAEVHQLRQDEWYVACGNDSCPVNPETSCFDTETDAIEAWNNSYNFKATCDWR